MQQICVFLLLLSSPIAIGHPCDVEVVAACPASAPEDISACLKEPTKHEAATTISAPCTAFIALNAECADEIQRLCSGAFFSDDTMVCLTQWVRPDDLSEKCVLGLNAAKPVDSNAAEYTMSEEEEAEKAAWRAERKAARGEALEHVKLEALKLKDPEEYERLIKEQDQQKKQAEKEQKEKERQLMLKRDKEKREAEKEMRKTMEVKVARETPIGNSNTDKLFIAIVILIGGSIYWMYGSKKSKSSSRGGGKKKRS